MKTIISHLFRQPHMARRIPVLILSVIMMGACIAVLDQIQFGTDPCTVFNLAMQQNVLHWPLLGTWQLVFNGVLIILILLMKEGRRIGLGTLANMVLVGYAKDFFSWVLNAVCPLTGAALGVKIAAFVPCMALFLVAVAFYIVVDLGVGPYDAMPQIIAARLKVNFSHVRVVYDVATMGVGWLIGGTVGVVTIITGFCLGPIIQAIANRFRPFFN